MVVVVGSVLPRVDILTGLIAGGSVGGTKSLSGAFVKAFGEIKSLSLPRSSCSNPAVSNDDASTGPTLINFCRLSP